MSRYKPLRLGDKMPFGKYKGLTIKEIITKDYNYFKWLENQTNVKFDIYGKSENEQNSNLASLDTRLKSGKFKGCTVAEAIRNDPEYVRRHKDKLDRQAQFYLDFPEQALKKLLSILTQNSSRTSDNSKVQDAIWLREGMNHMINLRIENPF